jgi:4-amino-4-deoxy-L-arabinose transferase-like glycosyltransferase
MNFGMTLLAQASAANNGSPTGGFIAGGFFIVYLILAVVALCFWLWMLIDCLTSRLPATEKLIWTLVILFLNFLGALLYFFIARGGRRTRSTV